MNITPESMTYDEELSCTHTLLKTHINLFIFTAYICCLTLPCVEYVCSVSLCYLLSGELYINYNYYIVLKPSYYGHFLAVRCILYISIQHDASI